MPRKGKTVVKSRSLPPLLRIPREIRDQIYSELLHDTPSSLFYLLTVNRRIYQEVQPCIFQQNLSFDGQLQLFDWILNVDHDFLPNVVSVEFKLHDIDPEKIVGALGERLRRTKVDKDAEHNSPRNNPYIEACEVEVRQIGRTLRLLENLKYFTLLPLTTRDPRPSRKMMNSFLSFLAAFLIGLPLISLCVPDQVLPFIPVSAIQNIKQLRIVGYSFGNSPCIIEYAEKLPWLRKLEVCRRDGEVVDQRTELDRTPIAQSRTTKTSPGFTTLKELTLCLYKGFSSPENPSRSVQKILQKALLALRDTSDVLRTLRIFVDGDIGLDRSFLIEMLSYLRSSSLVHIEMSCYLAEQLQQNFPSSLRSLEIRYSPRDAQALWQWLDKWEQQAKRGPHQSQDFFTDHPSLKDLVLHVQPAQAVDEVFSSTGYGFGKFLVKRADIKMEIKAWDLLHHRCSAYNI
ncbi:MAG: hypothetical protein LQ351_004179 [Letrouitia transgressa]|nr:MAG: hypothetical protein LQ351_004179 [Letrouitia transgressa]